MLRRATAQFPTSNKYMSEPTTAGFAPAAPPPSHPFPATEPLTIDQEIGIQIVADKELRRDLDAQLQKLKSLPGSRERNLSITKLQECIMWLGMDLKRLNDTRPYPSSYDPTNTKVEPTADNLKL